MLQHVILEVDSKLRSAQSPAIEMGFKRIFMSEEPLDSIKCICMCSFLVAVGFFVICANIVLRGFS